MQTYTARAERKRAWVFAFGKQKIPMTNQNTTPQRWGNLKAFQAAYPGIFSKTVAYDLRKVGKLRTKKLNGKTLWSFDSADALIASLPEGN